MAASISTNSCKRVLGQGIEGMVKDRYSNTLPCKRSFVDVPTLHMVQYVHCNYAEYIVVFL